jgi:hypothetical protein
MTTTTTVGEGTIKGRVLVTDLVVITTINTRAA